MKMMKKMMVAALAALCMMTTGCDGGVFDTEIHYTETTMEDYSWLTDSEREVFRKITVDDLDDAINNQKTGVILLGYPKCPHCQQSMTTIADTAVENGVYIYYLDAKEAVSDNDTAEKLMDILDPVLDADEESGEKLLFTPEVIKLDKGEFKDYEIGFDETTTPDRYKDIIS